MPNTLAKSSYGDAVRDSNAHALRRELAAIQKDRPEGDEGPTVRALLDRVAKLEKQRDTFFNALVLANTALRTSDGIRASIALSDPGDPCEETGLTVLEHLRKIQIPEYWRRREIAREWIDQCVEAMK